MWRELALAGWLIPAADLAEQSGWSLKDRPAITRENGPRQFTKPPRVRPRPAPSVEPVKIIPPPPEGSLVDRMNEGFQPFVWVQGTGARLALSPRELAENDLINGQIVMPSVAARIIEKRLREIEENREN